MADANRSLEAGLWRSCPALFSAYSSHILPAVKCRVSHTPIAISSIRPSLLLLPRNLMVPFGFLISSIKDFKIDLEGSSRAISPEFERDSRVGNP